MHINIRFLCIYILVGKSLFVAAKIELHTLYQCCCCCWCFSFLFYSNDVETRKVFFLVIQSEPVFFLVDLFWAMTWRLYWSCRNGIKEAKERGEGRKNTSNKKEPFFLKRFCLPSVFQASFSFKLMVQWVWCIRLECLNFFTLVFDQKKKSEEKGTNLLVQIHLFPSFMSNVFISNVSIWCFNTINSTIWIACAHHGFQALNHIST